jgi:tRNA dimethylallyltransferase
VFVLDWPRDALHCRIDARVDAMLSAGLLDEVRRLAESPHGLSRTARQALGYRELLEYARHDDPHAAALADAVAAIKAHTRQFAKRQLTWFRSLPECRRIELAGEPDALRVAQRIDTEMCRRA